MMLRGLERRGRRAIHCTMAAMCLSNYIQEFKLWQDTIVLLVRLRSTQVLALGDGTDGTDSLQVLITH